MPNLSRSPEWLSTEAAADELGLSQRTVYALINRGELGANRFGRVIRIPRAGVDSLIERTRVKRGDLDHLLPDSQRESRTEAESVPPETEQDES